MNSDSPLNDALARLTAAQQAAHTAVEPEAQKEWTVTEVAASWLRFLWLWRKAFLRALTISGVLGVAAAVLIPASYTARVTILPPENSGSGLSRLLSALPMAAAQMLGSPGESKMTELYVDIAKSDAVLTGVLDADYDGQTFREALSKSTGTPDWKLMDGLRRSFTGSKHPRTQLVMFELTRHDPKLAAAVLNQILKEMDHFFRYRVATTENIQRRMIETRLGEVTDSLRLAEEQLRQFKESNRTIMLSPKLMLDEGRLMREVEINNALYVELTKQLELARINETETMPVMNVLDYAAPPEKRSGPSRAMIVLSALAAGFCVAFVGLRFRESLPPRLRATLNLITGSSQPNV